jgi:purine-binding chemotaxis protein CheW
MIDYLVFDFLNGLYAIELNKVKSILVYSQVVISRLFTEKKWIKGVINLRGEVTPVVDLRIRFAEDKPNFSEDTVIIIVKTSENKLIGIIVDKIIYIKTFSSTIINHTPEIGIGIDDKYVQGLVKTEDDRMISLLHIDKILEIKELTQ